MEIHCCPAEINDERHKQQGTHKCTCTVSVDARSVTPAEAGVQTEKMRDLRAYLDPGLRRDDDPSPEERDRIFPDRSGPSPG